MSVSVQGRVSCEHAHTYPHACALEIQIHQSLTNSASNVCTVIRSEADRWDRSPRSCGMHRLQRTAGGVNNDWINPYPPESTQGHYLLSTYGTLEPCKTL